MLSHLITPNFQNISGPQIQMSVLQVQSREDAFCISIVSLTGLIILKDASPLALFQEKSPFEGIFFVLGDCPLHQVICFLISSTRHQLCSCFNTQELFCSHKCRRSTSKYREHSKSIVFYHRKKLEELFSRGREDVGDGIQCSSPAATKV